MPERIVDFVCESKNRKGFSLVEIVTYIDGSEIVDVFHVRTDRIEPNGQTIVWGKRKNGTYYIKGIRK